jgi:hypothetical protein
VSNVVPLSRTLELMVRQKAPSLNPVELDELVTWLEKSYANERRRLVVQVCRALSDDHPEAAKFVKDHYHEP